MLSEEIEILASDCVDGGGVWVRGWVDDLMISYVRTVPVHFMHGVQSGLVSPLPKNSFLEGLVG